MWFLFAFLAPAFYALSEILDNFLTNKEFKHPFTLVFYSVLLNVVFLPILFYFQPPVLPPLSTLPIFLLLGLVGIGYLWPYYTGLRADDTSVAISFFAIERVFVPVLAFLIVGEVLEAQQYIGIALVLLSVMALGLHRIKKRFRFSKAVWYIGFAALLLAFEGIFLKLLFDQGVTVSTAVGGESLIGMVFGLALAFSRKVRTDIRATFHLFLKLSPIFLIEEGFTFLGSWSEGTAISLTQVSVVKGITMMSPFFLLIYAFLGRKLYPEIFKEDFHRGRVLHKVLLFTLLVIGIVLIKAD